MSEHSGHFIELDPSSAPCSIHIDSDDCFTHLDAPSLNLQLKMMGKDFSSTRSFQGQLLYRKDSDLTGEEIVTHLQIREGLLVVEIGDARDAAGAVAPAALPATTDAIQSGEARSKKAERRLRP
ncbi:hypothetical protein FRC09_005029 [Ceratobasidium sp. 395]|nr:hypothetical protein FRC09_005029 [Ceratobasidium sp. 395]